MFHATIWTVLPSRTIFTSWRMLTIFEITASFSLAAPLKDMEAVIWSFIQQSTLIFAHFFEIFAVLLLSLVHG
jgi:hypothetical protein